VAGGFGAGPATDHKWLLNTVYAPTTVTRAETFLWYNAAPRLQLGVALLWQQKAFRYLASYQVLTETPQLPSLSVSAGVQGIGTGNPGFSATFEKNFPGGQSRTTAFAGVGWRTNENHGHPVAGLKYTPDGKWTLGLQHDGHETHPFLTLSQGPVTVGGYLINFRSPALLIGIKF
jgi:hypothetical protein